jgi:hypothetical protein
VIVQGLWIGQPITLVEFLSYSSFIAHGFEYHLYTYDDVGNLPDKVIKKDANEILERQLVKKGKDNSISGFADFFRYHLLHKKGGIYVDSDLICLKPFSTPQNIASGELQRHTQKTIASNQYLCFDPEHSLMRSILEMAQSKDLEQIEFGEIGPALVQKFVSPQNILPDSYFNPNPWWEWEKSLKPEHGDWFSNLVSKSDVYCVHMWNEMFRRNGVEKNCFPSGCFVDRLLTEYRH